MNLDNNPAYVKKSLDYDVKGQARISCPYTLANNPDTLKVSFWIKWEDDSFLEEISRIKETLQRTDSNFEHPYHCPGGFDWNVQRTGIKLFNYRLLAGDIRLFLNNRSFDGDIPNSRLEIGSESCWAPGYNNIYEDFIQWINLLGGSIVKEIISEVHLALDIVGLKMQDLDITNEDYWIKRLKHFNIYHENRYLTGISIGKGTCALRVYDKVYEIHRSGNKQLTFIEFWGVNHFAEKPVTRVEFQLRREILKTLKTSQNTDTGIDTIKDLNSGMNSLWQFCTSDRVRHCSGKVDFESNHQTRSENSDFWNLVSSVKWIGKTPFSQFKPRPKKDIVALRKQYTGLAMTIAAFYGVHSEDLDHIIDITKHVVEEDLINLYRDNEPEFIKRIEKKKREIYESISYLHNLKPIHPEYVVYPTPYGFESDQGENRV